MPKPPSTSSEIRVIGRRETIAYWRDLGTLLRDLLIAILVVFCLLRPEIVRTWLASLGVSKATIFGLELTPGNEEKLATTINTLTQQRDAAIAERNVFAARATQALTALSKVQGASRGVQRALAEISKAAQTTPKITSAQEDIVQGAREALGRDAQWAAVFGSDLSLDQAQYEISWAKAHNIPAQIVHRQNWYVSVAFASSLDAAQQTLSAVRARGNEAFLVNVRTWCPKLIPNANYQECSH